MRGDPVEDMDGPRIAQSNSGIEENNKVEEEDGLTSLNGDQKAKTKSKSKPK